MGRANSKCIGQADQTWAALVFSSAVSSVNGGIGYLMGSSDADVDI